MSHTFIGEGEARDCRTEMCREEAHRDGRLAAIPPQKECVPAEQQHKWNEKGSTFSFRKWYCLV